MFTKQMSSVAAALLLAVFCRSAAAEGVSLGINIPCYPPGYSTYGGAPVFVPLPVSVSAVRPPTYVRPAPGFLQAPVSSTTTVTGPVYQVLRSMAVPPAPAPAAQPATAPVATFISGRWTSAPSR